ncbi:transporter substrate-binding domain-containing protein [Telmatospirillum sp.]|uniref:substrate-binding periplasmic protein n=1 Tax=Telmatospirillum sp. TaxID=2079197 RepID=UPI002843B63F|nr:transporter substrate-binding domain-containing protein [Telmatospirillum sp.]MDR3436651.1 transporter substrate-binding domain-containing protein [Telmatospirillum sp.]
MRCGLAIAVAIATMLVATHSGFARDLQLYASEAPPLTMPQEGMHGIVGDVVLEAAKRTGHTVNLHFDPWVREQAMVADGVDLLIAPLSRTAEREDHFTWIAPVIDVGLGFATVGNTVSSYAEGLVKFQKIALLRASIGRLALPRQGFADSQLFEVHTLTSVLELLRRGRADAWFDSIPVLKWVLKQQPDTTDIIVGPPVAKVGSYLACSKVCAPDLVKSLRGAIDEIKADGTYDKILARYQ